MHCTCTVWRNLSRELDNERNIVQNLRLQLEAVQTTANILESENEDMGNTLKKKHFDVENLRKALHDCQKMLCASEADVDASIRSKETLLKTFQVWGIEFQKYIMFEVRGSFHGFN